MTIPLVFNDDPFNLVQLTMHGSVGLGGRNDRRDVIVIQRLLNAVPANRGGQQVSLVVDGIVGSKTISAISRFQSSHSLIADGRIDCSKSSIKKLLPLVRSLNLLPTDLPSIAKPDQRVVSALSPGVSGSQTRSSVTGWMPTKWKFSGSGSTGLSVAFFGATGGDFLVVADDQPKMIYRLAYLGVTVGLSVMPVGFDIAFESMPSAGSRIRKSPTSNLTYDKAGDFVGSCNFVTVEANLGPGVAGSIVEFTGGFFSSARGALAGAQVGIPTIGISLCVGAVAGWR
jgi:peptidoglycan hydrolase-like protein with peptidoglycan-binding domain